MTTQRPGIGDTVFLFVIVPIAAAVWVWQQIDPVTALGYFLAALGAGATAVVAFGLMIVAERIRAEGQRRLDEIRSKR